MRLSVAIHTRDSERRLARVVGEARRFADEIVIGVDSSSTDRTFGVASGLGDSVYLFRHDGYHGPARALALEYSRGDWILVLDDDEGLDERLAHVLPELLGDERYTHYWFPRKWIVAERPHAYLRASPWFPDWQLRLFRNDRSLVWKPPAVHTAFRVMGTGCFEDRGAILHYEPLLLSAAQRAEKIARYSAHGSTGRCEEFYALDSAGPRVALESLPLEPSADQSERTAPRIDRHPRPMNGSSPFPPWGHRLEVRAPEAIGAGESVIVEVDARNAGRLAWFPSGNGWPRLNVSYHIYRASGELLNWDGERSPMPRIVAPGEAVRIFCLFTAPDAPGEYDVAWDLVSEGECWFSQCGMQDARHRIRVLLPDSVPGPRPR